MTPYYEREGIRLYVGDNRDVVPQLDAQVSAVVTDPPYGLSKEPDMAEVLTHWLAGDDYTHSGGGFMGKSWDSFVPGPATWKIIASAMLPGAHLLSFAGTRTSDLMGIAIRLAGLERRDTACWLMGSGFPKSLDVSKAIDKVNGNPLAFREFARAYAAAVKASDLTHSDIDRHLGIKSSSCYWAREDHRGGMPPRHHWEQVRELLDLSWELELLYAEAEREVIGNDTKARSTSGKSALPTMGGDTVYESWDITAPATPEAEQWAGWGTALKPAHEDIGIFRKPLTGTVAAQVLATGTGAINVDGCRIGTTDTLSFGSREIGTNGIYQSIARDRQTPGEQNPAGRWPANVILDEEASALLDAMSGVSKSQRNDRGGLRDIRGDSYGRSDGRDRLGANGQEWGYNDTGGASRFMKVIASETDDISVDCSDTSSDNEGDKEYPSCSETVSIADDSSTQSRTTFVEDLAAIAPENAGDLASARTAGRTLGDTTARAMADGIGSGGSQEAGNFISNSNTDGSGSKPTGQSLTDTKSITSTKTNPITTSATLNASPLNGTTTTTSASERITASSTASNIESASDAANTSVSAHSVSGGLEPITDIASFASMPTFESGEPVGAIPSLPIDEPGTLRFLYCPKASRAERNQGLDTPSTRLKLRDDLTPEQRTWVLSQLEASGVAL